MKRATCIQCHKKRYINRMLPVGYIAYGKITITEHYKGCGVTVYRCINCSTAGRNYGDASTEFLVKINRKFS